LVKGTAFVDDSDDWVGKGDHYSTEGQHCQAGEDESLTDAIFEFGPVLGVGEAGEDGQHGDEQDVGDDAQGGLDEEAGVSKGCCGLGDEGGKPEVCVDIDLQHSRGEGGGAKDFEDVADSWLVEVEAQAEGAKTGPPLGDDLN